MTYILTCGCESKYGGFPSEWDGESRECEPAVFYGCLCDKHFGEYDARPAQLEPRELSKEDIYGLALEAGFMLSTQYGQAEDKLMPVSDGATLMKLAELILKKASEK